MGSIRQAEQSTEWNHPLKLRKDRRIIGDGPALGNPVVTAF